MHLFLGGGICVDDGASDDDDFDVQSVHPIKFIECQNFFSDGESSHKFEDSSYDYVVANSQNRLHTSQNLSNDDSCDENIILVQTWTEEFNDEGEETEETIENIQCYINNGSLKRKNTVEVQNQQSKRRFNAVNPYIVGECLTVEKEYLRLNNEPHPKYIRPRRVLVEALGKIELNWQSSRNYNYANSQLKSIRQDLFVSIINYNYPCCNFG